jgi:hypothetical protein
VVEAERVGSRHVANQFQLNKPCWRLTPMFFAKPPKSYVAPVRLEIF